MNEFTGEAKDGFGILGFLSHLFISVSVLLVIVSLIGFFINHDAAIFGYLIAGGGAGVLTGIGLGFLNILVS